LFTFYLGKPDHAWQLTRAGMGRLFKYRFLPELFALQGFGLLANIAAEQQNLESPGPLGPDLEPELGSDFAVAGVQIPRIRIKDEGALIHFIRDVTTKLGELIIARVKGVERADLS